MRTPADKEIIFTLYSHPTKRLDMRWKAKLVFAPGSTDESEATLSVVDGLGASIARGRLDFAGAAIDIRDGRGVLKCGDFVRGKHEGAIWLHRNGMLPIPGALTFE